MNCDRNADPVSQGESESFWVAIEASFDRIEGFVEPKTKTCSTFSADFDAGIPRLKFLSIFPAESDSGISERTLPSTFSAERDSGMPGSPPKLLSTFSAESDSGMPRRNAQPPTSCCR